MILLVSKSYDYMCQIADNLPKMSDADSGLRSPTQSELDVYIVHTSYKPYKFLNE